MVNLETKEKITQACIFGTDSVNDLNLRFLLEERKRIALTIEGSLSTMSPEDEKNVIALFEYSQNKIRRYLGL